MSRPARTLPPDFDRTLDTAIHGRILDERSRALKERARVAIEEAATAHEPDLLGRSPAAWAEAMLETLERTLHMELCRPNGDGLKAEYDDILEHALTREGIADLAAIVLRVARAISPALAVSTVAIYVAVWLLKAGLNRWCVVAADTPRGPTKSPPRSNRPSRRGKRGRRAA